LPKSAQLTLLLFATLAVVVLAAFSSIQAINPIPGSAAAQNQSNPYANSHSQAVADWVINNMYSTQVNMLATDPSPGCVDTLGGVTVPCADAFWTTSDNLPTCATLIDFGYASESDACINKILGCDSAYVPSEWQTSDCSKNQLNFEFTATSIPTSEQGTWLSGFRYEAFFAIPIPIGAPGDQHFIISTGTLQNGKPYAIKADIATLSIGTQSFSGPVDVVAPQCIDEYLRGNLAKSTECANDLIGSWDGNGVGGAGAGGGSGLYSTWQLGQAMFVMRVLGMDTSSSSIATGAGTTSYSNLFNAMEAKLWAVQAAYSCPVGSSGCLPNAYNAANQGSGGTDAENQDAGLLPFSSSVINLVKNSFGECTASSAPPGPVDSTLCDSAASSTTTTGSSVHSINTSSTTKSETTSTTATTPDTSVQSTSVNVTTTAVTMITTFSSIITSEISSNISSTLASTSTQSSTNRITSTITPGLSSLTTSKLSYVLGVTATINSLEAAKVQSAAAITMGTGSGAIVFLAGLFPLSYILKNDLYTKKSRRGRSISSLVRGDTSRERIGRN
jgi:hypothetical protein